MGDTTQLIFNAVLSVVLAVVAAGVLTLRQTKKKLSSETNKTDIEAAAQLSETALAILKQARTDAESAGVQARASREEAEATRADIRLLRGELEGVREFVGDLLDWIREQGLTPPTADQLKARHYKQHG